VGTTEVDSDEENLRSELQVFGPEKLQEAAESVSGPVYLSFDIDSLDVEATGYPDGELSTLEAAAFMEELDVRHADLVEVAPPLGDDAVKEARKAVRTLSRFLRIPRE